MATFYCLLPKRTNGDGSSGNPWQPSQISLSNNDTLIFRGTGNGSAVIPTFSSLSGITLMGEDPLNRPIIDGAEVVAGPWVQEGAPNTSCWTATVSGTVGAVTWDFAEGSDGLFRGQLRTQTTLANCQANNNSYFITGTSLSVNRSGQDPTTHAVAILRAGPGLLFSDCSNVTIKNLIIRRWASTSLNTAMGIRLALSLDNFTLDNVWIHDTRHRNIGLAAATGPVNDGSLTIRNCRFGGVGQGAGTQIMTGVTADAEPGIYSFQMINSIVYVSSWRDPDGGRVGATITVDSSGVTTNYNTGTASTGLISGCTFVQNALDIAMPFRWGVSPGDLPAPTSANDWTTYPAKVVQTRVTGGSCLYGDTSWSAYQSSFEMMNAATQTLTYPIDLGSASMLNFTACEFTAPAATNSVIAGAGSYSAYHVAGGSNADVRFIACTFRDQTSGGAIRSWTIGDSGACSVSFYSCLFSTATSRAFLTEGASATLAYETNAYHGYSGYSNNAARDTWAEWVATVDTTGVEIGDPLFRSPSTGDLRLSPASPVWRRPRRTATATAAKLVGRNGKGYTGQRGASQGFASEPHTRSRDTSARARAQN